MTSMGGLVDTLLIDLIDMGWKLISSLLSSRSIGRVWWANGRSVDLGELDGLQLFRQGLLEILAIGNVVKQPRISLVTMGSGLEQ
jgi:hypothetical protein